MNNKEYWNNIFNELKNKKPVCDLWLDKYRYLFHRYKESIIIDLGCGAGPDSLYLAERGYNVIACDFSDEALKIVKSYNKNIETLNIDISEKLPFKDERYYIVIADLSLHYFSSKKTKMILLEIKRILKSKGYLICRLNSINDINYGALMGKYIEKNYYYNDGQYKRFFDSNAIKYYFKDWDIEYYKEELLDKYGVIKKVWEVVIRRK